jgi:hypothetical protein
MFSFFGNNRLFKVPSTKKSKATNPRLQFVFYPCFLDHEELGATLKQFRKVAGEQNWSFADLVIAHDTLSNVICVKKPESTVPSSLEYELPCVLFVPLSLLRALCIISLAPTFTGFTVTTSINTRTPLAPPYVGSSRRTKRGSASGCARETSTPVSTVAAKSLRKWPTFKKI